MKKKVNSKNIENMALSLALKLAQESGKFLLLKQKKLSSLKISAKDAQGMASNADVESEKKIIKGILRDFPEHFILAEESAFKEFKGEMSRYNFLKEKEWVWIIDPLDGTHNYLNGLDYFGVCISLVHFGEPVVGVVLRPSNGDCFYATKTKGSFYKNIYKKSVRPKKLFKKENKKTLKESMLVTGFTTEKGVVFDQEFELFKHMMGRSRGIRRMGSAALDLCYVANGVFDCFWERGLASWDVAAAGLICQKANVTVTDYNGRDFHPFQETILAARSPLHREILNLFSTSL